MIAPCLIFFLAEAVLGLGVLVYLQHKRKPPMTVSATAQAIADELTAAATTVQTIVANAATAADAQSTEDLAAIKTAADGLVAAINAAAPPA